MSNLDPSQIGSFLNQSYNPNPPNYLTNPNPYQFTPLASTSAYTHSQQPQPPNSFTPLSHQHNPSHPPTASTSSAPDLAVDPPGGNQGPDGAARPDPLAKGKKRKSSAGPGPGPGPGLPEGAPPEDEVEKEKRQKIPRACDNCRRKKIRSVDVRRREVATG